MSNVADDSVFATEIELPPPFFLNVTLSDELFYDRYKKFIWRHNSLLHTSFEKTTRPCFFKI